MSDYQMPGLTGTELAAVFIAERPDSKILLISGFPGRKMDLSAGWSFLAKPFTAGEFRRLVTDLTSEAVREVPTGGQVEEHAGRTRTEKWDIW